MSSGNVIPPYPLFYGAGTDGLSSGYIYIGQENQDPEAVPLTVYWDIGLTEAALQPLRTINGYISRAGTPSRVFIGSRYSIKVKDSSGSVVYTSLSNSYLTNRSEIDAYRRFSGTFTAGQTDITVPEHTVGGSVIWLNINGSSIQTSAFTELNSTTIRLTNGRYAGDTYEGWVIGFIEDVAVAGSTWGSIIGTLSNQTDLQAALDAKTSKLNPDAAMGALVIDTTADTVNTKSLATDATYTFSATAGTGSKFVLEHNNTDTAWHKLTIPSSYSDAQKQAITETWVPPGETVLVWRYDGTTYTLLGDHARRDNLNAVAAPTSTDDEDSGYGVGSVWIYSGTVYQCTSATASSAVWSNLSSGFSSTVKIVTGSYTLGTDNEQELYNGTIYIAGAHTLTIPQLSSIATPSAFKCTVIVSAASVANVDPNANDLIRLDGVALDDGDKLTSDGTINRVVDIRYYDATGFYAVSDGGWVDGGV